MCNSLPVKLRNDSNPHHSFVAVVWSHLACQFWCTSLDIDEYTRKRGNNLLKWTRKWTY